jgi:hypothetical protein
VGKEVQGDHQAREILVLHRVGSKLTFRTRITVSARPSALPTSHSHSWSLSTSGPSLPALPPSSYSYGMIHSVSGVGNDADLLIPVDIVSATRNSFPNRLRRPAAAIAPVVPEENDDLVLPPSYFEVMET